MPSPFLPAGSRALVFLAAAIVPFSMQASDRVEPVAVPTFNCVGLYWKPASGAPDNACPVRYRAAGEKGWKEALPLWFDPTDHPGNPEHSKEYRGSIVNLQPGTKYEIKLRLEKSGEEKIIATSTWSDSFPVKKTVVLKADAPQPVTITEGGDADGYVVYTAAAGTVFDGKGQADCNIRVNASHVILRGLTLKNAGINGVELGDVQDIVIEHCDISGWGRIASDGYGVDLDAAISSRSKELQRVVVQDNRLHHPRSNANSWTEERTRNGRKSKHPIGPQAITFAGSQGRLVIRRNKIYSDLRHMFNDSMGEVRNFSYAGFPNRDSDIYGNEISQTWDDGVEVEGADMNVRVWSNSFDNVYGAVGTATASLGPIYIFRNVLHAARKGPKEDADSNKGAYLVKLGNEKEQWGKGKIFVFHNTMLQPPPRFGFSETSGGNSGLLATGPKKYQINITSRNNILYVRTPDHPAIKDSFMDPSNDYDYDLYNGVIRAAPGQEKHGIRATPRFDTSNPGRYPLLPGTPGVDAAQRLPNFNDTFSGAAPDIGAFESR